MTVGQQEGVGDFVYQEKGPWRRRNKAWDRAGPACGWSGKRARARTAVGAVACMSQASPSSASTPHGIFGLFSWWVLALSHI